MVLNFVTLSTGALIGTAFGVSKPDRRTLSIETGIQNSGLALVLIFNPKLFAANGGMAFMAAWWGIWQMLTGIGLAGILGKIRMKKKDGSSYDSLPDNNAAYMDSKKVV